jgi:CO dehydrogenase/acetyl-CoA synthase beta subunit
MHDADTEGMNETVKKYTNGTYGTITLTVRPTRCCGECGCLAQ